MHSKPHHDYYDRHNVSVALIEHTLQIAGLDTTTPRNYCVLSILYGVKPLLTSYLISNDNDNSTHIYLLTWVYVYPQQHA